jgi:two-component system KDP operon response regulator KdpE
VKKTRILVVDDEISIRKLLKANLETAGYEVLMATDGADAIRVFELEKPDFVILDIMMPEMDGFEVCRRIREWSLVPIIVLSAKLDEVDKVNCLNLGADDYITKPFGKEELIARVSAVLRRTEPSTAEPSSPVYRNNNLEINFSQRRVTVNDKEVRLTPTEYNLLQELVTNAGKVLTHHHLLNNIWGPEYAEEREYLHVFIRRIRAKIEEDPAAPVYILTVPGIGYQFTNSA